MNQRTHRIGGADGVRALACLMVMAHHACQRLDLSAQLPWVQQIQTFLLTGSSGVAVFFVLSGYLLSSPFWRNWAGGYASPSLGDFALRRWARIAPAFWLNLTLTFVLALTFVPGAPEMVWRYVAGMTFTSSLTWQTFFPVEINGPLWSIGFEVFSYVLLGLFLFLWFKIPGRRTPLRGLGFWTLVFALAVGGQALFLAFGQTDIAGKGWQFGMFGGAKYWWPMYNPVGFFATFVLGVLAAGATEYLGRAPGLSGRRGLWDALAGGALILTVLLLWSLRLAPDFAFSWPLAPYYFPLFPLLIAVVLAVAPLSGWVGTALDNPVARFLATISFGLYIWHYLLLEMARMVWPDLSYMKIDDLGTWALKIGVVYGASAVLATLSWYFFEKPIVRWSQSRRRPA